MNITSRAAVVRSGIVLLGLAPLFLLAACEQAPIEVSCDGCCCSDDTGGVTAGAPDAKMSHDVVDLGILCETGQAEFTISNSGDGVLTLDAPVFTGGWTMVEGATEVQPGDTVTITVLSGAGDGSVAFTTNDPNNPTLTVSLLAESNQDPTIDLASTPPIIAPGAMELFQARLDDDQGPTFLDVEWRSDVDGVLDTSGTDASGLAEMEWDATLRTVGAHTMTLTVEDECGASATQSFQVCQNEGYSEENMDLSSWTFSGNANWDSANNWLELTTDGRYKAGTAFMTTETVSSDNVSIDFKFYAGARDGADGLSLTAIDTTRMTTYKGSAGGGIGYGSLPGWSVEVDTWNNAEYTEPTVDSHVALVIDGASTGPGVVFSAIPSMEDGAWHDMSVEVIGQHITVSIDGVVYIDQDVPELVAFPAHVGFTAATGFSTNYHLIDSLVVESSACDSEEEG